MGENEIKALPPPGNRRNKYPGIDPLVVSVALSAARKAVNGHGFSEADLPDLEQELVLAALKVLESFDQEKGNKGALIKTAVNRRLIDLHRYRRGRRRDYRITSSLDRELHSEDNGSGTLLDLVTSDGVSGMVTPEQINPYDQEFTNRHIRENMEKLPPHLRDLCYDLQQMPVRHVAAKRKVSPHTIYKGIRKIRRELKKMEGKHAKKLR